MISCTGMPLLFLKDSLILPTKIKGDILGRMKAYEDALLDIWSILPESEEDYNDSQKVKVISKVKENII
ncbi:hypothetical protein B0O40_0367 [Ruminococcaceae bacterium R-25]|nr:hypothetical protein B0O40_0367 [Ruminococcaceae bacterium R-25]SUQ11004.1 hypothetical protein SAMN06297423_0367 [Oscillospiraceae bacterium]